MLLRSTGHCVRQKSLKSTQTKRRKARTRPQNNSLQHKRRRAKRGLNTSEVSYYQRIWWDALCDLRSQLAAHCRGSEPDKLRFQTRRLLKNLTDRLPKKNRLKWIT